MRATDAGKEWRREQEEKKTEGVGQLPAVPGAEDQPMSYDKLIQEITIKASASRVFEALTSPRELVEWWGVAEKFQATELESDLRPGGKWRMHVTTGNGAKLTVAGEYCEVDR